MIVLARTSSDVAGATISVPVPPHVELARLNAAVAVLKFCAAVTFTDVTANVPAPLIVPLV